MRWQIASKGKEHPDRERKSLARTESESERIGAPPRGSPLSPPRRAKMRTSHTGAARGVINIFRFW